MGNHQTRERISLAGQGDNYDHAPCLLLDYLENQTTSNIVLEVDDNNINHKLDCYLIIHTELES